MTTSPSASELVRVPSARVSQLSLPLRRGWRDLWAGEVCLRPWCFLTQQVLVRPLVCL